MILDGCVDVGTGEAMGFLEALSWIKGLSLQNVIVEGGTKSTVDAIVGSGSCIASFGNIVIQCKSLLSSLCNVSISFVKRHAKVMRTAISTP